VGNLRKADLHLHTRHSGWQRLRLVDALDCYLDPVEAVETALGRGMDFVALTDHDSIGGWQEVFARRPDLRGRVIPGVEVEATFPGWGLKVHINFLGVDEMRFRQLEKRRGNAYDLLRYAREQRLLAVLNHPLRTLWRKPRLRRFLAEAPDWCDGYEVLNSASPMVGNCAATDLAALAKEPRAAVGGSDAHTLARIATAWTVAEGETAGEFLDSVRRGACSAGGRASGLTEVIADVYRVVGRYYASLGGDMFRGAPARRLRNLFWATMLLPGAVLMPTFMTALNDGQYRCTSHWIRRLARKLQRGSLSEPYSQVELQP